MQYTNNILSILESYTLDNADDIAKSIADDLRKRRIEKNITRDQLAELSGVAISNIVRFEQKGLISLKNLIGLAMAKGVWIPLIPECTIIANLTSAHNCPARELGLCRVAQHCYAFGKFFVPASKHTSAIVWY